MLTYYLEKGTLIPLNKEVPFLEINELNFKDSTLIIQQAIDLFNSELTWNDMFNVEISRDRISMGHRMFIGIENNKVYGYFWVDFIDDSYYFYNVFTTKNFTRFGYTGRHLLSTVIKGVLFDKPCFCKIDEWNKKSINLFKKMGFILKKIPNIRLYN
jgi:hypothetical protein